MKMSFSSEVKSELYEQYSGNRKALTAGLAAILDCIGTWNDEPGGQKSLILRTDNRMALTKCFTLLQKTANIICMSDGTPENGVISLSELLPEKDLQRVLSMLEMAGEGTDLWEPGKGISKGLLKNDMCSRAYLRDTFLCIGTVSNPEKEYQLEFTCGTQEKAQQIKDVLSARGITSGISLRRGNHVVYLRESSQIVDMLNLMGASSSSMKMENAIILRQVRGSINRKVNCETSNIRKSAQAARRQIEDIKLLMGSREFENLPETLKEIAKLRVENPEVSLKELGEMLDPPVGKSGVNHRLRKLSETAEEIRLQSQQGHIG